MFDRFERIYLNINSDYDLAELQAEQANYALIGLDVISENDCWWMPHMELYGFKFWSDRSLYLSNQFPALAVNELTRQTVSSAVKPWQAPDNNYVFVRIPEAVNFPKKLIKDYHFNNLSDYENWYRIDGSGGQGTKLIFDPNTGYLSNGSLEIQHFSPKYQLVRFVSKTFPVAPNFGYRVEAFVKSQVNLDKNSRDGFLRLDFYNTQILNINETTIGIKTDLSERYFGLRNWKKLSVSGIAPNNAKYATVSFEVSDPSAIDFWLDDVSIFQSQTATTENNNIYQIPEEVLYPYSPAGL